MNYTVKDALTKIEELFQAFNSEFYDGELQLPIITISKDFTKMAYGWCTTKKVWHDSSINQDYYEINICAEYLNRDLNEVCATLLHEMVHLWNLQNDIQDCSRGGFYHNKKFKETAEERGLIIERHKVYGWTITSLTPDTAEFIKSLDENNFTLFRISKETAEETDDEETTKPKRKSNIKKYTCPICGTEIKSKTEVRIICKDCNVEFELEG